MAANFLSGLFGKKPAATEASTSAPAASADAAPPEPEFVSSFRSMPMAFEDRATDDVGPPRKNLFARLAEGLTRSSSSLADGVAAIFTKKKLDQATLDELEELLIAADLGAPVAARVAAKLAEDRFDKEISGAEVRAALAEAVAQSLSPCERAFEIDRSKKPFVILMAGVNGSGKTTTIGKLAAKFAREGLVVTLAAGDTFRAAAIEQLSLWGARAGAEVVARPVGSDASGLAYEALERARAAGADVLLIDTAGRLQNRRELMDELAKIVRVLKKLDPDAPHATLLTLDATVGQNALSQTEIFREIAGVTGLIMTKLDGTARGGILVALAERFRLPIYFIGIGESIDDLQPFGAAAFARALAGAEEENA